MQPSSCSNLATVIFLHSFDLVETSTRAPSLFNMRIHIMRFRSLLLVLPLLGGLSACNTRYEAFADPSVNPHDAQLLALAPQPSASGNDPYRGRFRMSNTTREPAGTIVIETDARFLYLVEEGGTMLRYPISPGADAYQWKGKATVGRKAEWPGWTPGPEARKLSPGLPASVSGGPLSPLGSRGLYLYEGNKDTQYRIHGTNEPEMIGEAVSLGCIRMQNIDAIDLYARVKLGTPVIVR